MTDDDLSGDTVYKVESLRAIRAALKLTQADMAKYMGLSFRAYQALEGRQNPIRRMHMLLAMQAAIECLVEFEEPELVDALAQTDIADALFNNAVKIVSLARDAAAISTRSKRPKA